MVSGTGTAGVDPTSVSSLRTTVDETVDLLVVGAGVAGCTAAIEAARAGLSVVLVDENPVDLETMGNEVPLHFGGRAGGAARNRTAMTEAMLEATPLLADAFEVGVDLRLSTACWGLFLAAPTVAWVDRPVAGLADPDGVRHLGFTAAVVATGTRDMGLAFAGWELPGVMGGVAARRLAGLYGALDARRVVIVGSGTEGLLCALDLAERGVEVAAIVEVAETPRGPAPLVGRVAGRGIEILCGHAVARAEGGVDGVTAIAVVAVAGDGRHRGTGGRRIDCDTVVLAVAAVPMIDLLEAAGCRMVFDPARGGHVPVVDAGQRTSRPGIYAVGDVAGVWPEKSSGPALAEAEARRAIAAILGRAPAPVAAPEDAGGFGDHLKRWVRASVVDAEGAPVLCQCEDVTARDILGVRPPKYLGWEPASPRLPTQKPSDLAALLGNGPPSPDQVKRLTRAGMGTCQGRRCREQVAVLLALEAGIPVEDIPLASYRTPVRPLRLDHLADRAETAEQQGNWQIWFGIETMGLAPWELGPDGRAPGDRDG